MISSMILSYLKIFKNPRKKNIFLFCVKLAISIPLTWWVLKSVDIGDSAERIQDIDFGWSLAALACFIFIILLGGLRWYIFYNALSQTAPLHFLLSTNFTATFLGQILPAGIGSDAARIWFLSRKEKKLGNSISSVILDRLAGVASLLILIAIFIPVLFSYVSNEEARYAIIILLICGGLGLVFLFFLACIPNHFKHFKLMASLASHISVARKEGLSLRPVLLSLILSLFLHLMAILVVKLLANSIGLEIDFIICLALIPAVMLIATLPISLAGWGIREGAMVTAFAYVGMVPSDALALSVLFGLITIVASMPGMFIWLIQGKLKKLYSGKNTY